VHVRITVRSKNVQLSEALRSHCEKRASRALDQFTPHVEHVEIVLASLNGPRGSRPKACSVFVGLREGSRLMLQQRGDDFYVAAGQAASRAAELVARMLDRTRAQRRAQANTLSPVEVAPVALAVEREGARQNIVVTDHDERQLHRLLSAARSSRDSELADALEGELQRARIVDAGAVPSNVVTMNSTVVYEDENTGARAEVKLVYPDEAQINAGRLSVLAPLGTALLGLAVGESIDWTMPDGRNRRLRVLAVPHQPEAAERDLAG
jgi:regulator of nucleoside diphosphate kinase